MFALCLCGCGPGHGDDGTTGGDGSTTDGEPPPPFDVTRCGDWIDAGATSGNGAPIASLPAPSCLADPSCATFEEQARDRGLRHVQFAQSSPETGTCLFSRDGQADDCEPQWYSAGVAVGDVDGDGWPDLFFTRWSAPDVLYRNRGDGTFEDITAEAGLDRCTFSNGAAFGDIDDDGDQDLVVTMLGAAGHLLYLNDGTGVFVEDGEARGLALGDGPRGGHGVALGDYDLDGDLDLHIAEWMRPRHLDDELPDEYGARLLRNDGTGHFQDVTSAAGVDLRGRRPGEPGVYAFASAFVDLDGDDRPELAVAGDFRTAALFWGGEDGTFTDGTEAAGVNDAGNPMGSTFGDLDGDGDLDWFVTGIAQRASCAHDPCPWLGTGNRLYRNDGGRVFAEISEPYAVRDAGWGWGAAWFDMDGDGDLDLAATNGWPGPDLEGARTLAETPARLWIADGPLGAPPLRDEASRRGFDDRGQGRGLVPLDVDRDGDLDVVVARHGDTPLLFINRGVASHHWLAVRVRGDVESHGEARGAVVRVQATADGPVQTRQVGVGAHFGGSGPLELLFGLGETDRVARIEARWPVSGRTLTLTDVPADARIELRESDAMPP